MGGKMCRLGENLGFLRDGIELFVKRRLVLFYVFGWGDAEDADELFAEVTGIADSDLEGGLAHIHVLGEHQDSGFAEPDGADKGIQALAGDGFHLLVEAGMAHAHGLGEFLHGKFLVVNVLLDDGDTFFEEVLVFDGDFHGAFL